VSSACPTPPAPDLVVSFLPHTVHFEIEQAKRSPPFLANISRHPSQIRVGDYGSPSTPLSLFGSTQHQPIGHAPATPARTPPESEHNGFFLPASEPKTPTRKIIMPLTSIPSVAPSEPHSPAWGRTTFFTQPKSRAGKPPPPDILSHTLPFGKEDRPGRKLDLTFAGTRESSNERALQSADWTIQPSEQGNSGLRVAVNAAYKADSLPDKTWVGTLGMPTDALDDIRKDDIRSKLEAEYDCLAVFPTDSDFDGHYSHYSKTMLWPVFHYQIPDNPKSKAYQDHSWVYYVKVNQVIADTIVKNYKKGDVIWVHDYHLLLVPSMVRQKLPEAEIGFYLHVAFPSSEVFRCLAMRKELLEGLLGANMIGFQTQEYCIHFLQTCSRLLNVEATPNGVQLEDRFVNVDTFPMGVDLDELDCRRHEPEVLDWITKMQNKYPEKHLIVARDKLDHVRGVRQKLLSYELFLNKYPEYRDKVVLIQVATSTTEQAELDATVSDIVTRINSQHSTLAHQPLVFLKQDMEYAQYLAMLSSADALMITSLREGMNLTSHEFLLCQDGSLGTKKHGSLILSEFTGSASLFNGRQLSVNPWDYRQCAEAIRKTIEMGSVEKAERWNKLMDTVKHYSGGHWVTTYLEKLHDAWDQHSRQHTISIPRLSIKNVCETYKTAHTRLFMLDYEGTLAAHDAPGTMLFDSPQRTLDTLTELIAVPGNIVYVMSGKRPEELDMIFQRVPGLGMIAENGCFVKDFDTDMWQQQADLERMAEWKESIAKVLEYYQERIEGSFIEERYCSMLFSYGEAMDQVGAARAAGDCANHINDACRNLHVHAVPIDGGLVIESTEWSKGTAAERIFEGLKKRQLARGQGPPEFLLVAGDSREDEVIYRWANDLGEKGVVRDVMTVSLSSRNTEAMATLNQGVTGKFGLGLAVIRGSR
jgi:trehalose 6-phosphate synthase complex regulatory subunit